MGFRRRLVAALISTAFSLPVSGGGGGGGTAPAIMYTDFVAGPTTGGDGGEGDFLTLYGFNFGAFADWGVTSHVTVGGVEVANYRCLTHAVESGGGVGRGVWDTWGLWALTVQVGALGSPPAGVPLKIDMSVGGTHPVNAKNGSGLYLGYAPKMDGTRVALTYTPQPGLILFLDRANGSDSNDGLTPATPKKTLQGPTGFTGAFKCATGDGATDGMKPGTHIFDLTSGAVDAGGLGGFAVDIFRISGTLPTGGANRGPICYSRYPGAAGANSPAAVFIQGKVNGNGDGGGGFNGNDQARASETNPYDGLTGWGRSIHISNVKIVSSIHGERDGAPINMESGADDWRVVNCDLSWPWVSNNSGVTNAAGVVGNGKGVWILGNYIHDIQGVVADNQNHGIYIDGSLNSANGVVVFLNCIYRITAGNGVQSFNVQAGNSIKNISVDSNWIENVHKHAVTVADSTESQVTSNNILIDAGESAYHISSGAVTAANGIKSFNNTGYGFAQVVKNRAAWWNEGGNGGGAASTDTRNCIFTQKAGSTGTYDFVVKDVGTDHFTDNVFFDFEGNRTSVSASFGTYHDPGLTDPTTGDFSLLADSVCVDAGAAPLVARPYDFFCHTNSGTPDIGAAERGAVFG